MHRLILIALLAALAGCESYTDKTSPCIGRSGKPVVSRNDTGLMMSFLPTDEEAGPDPDCTYRPLGNGE